MKCERNPVCGEAAPFRCFDDFKIPAPAPAPAPAQLPLVCAKKCRDCPYYTRCTSDPGICEELGYIGDYLFCDPGDNV